MFLLIVVCVCVCGCWHVVVCIDDLNRTHQHCVLAGDTARFSSTHRVVQVSVISSSCLDRTCSIINLNVLNQYHPISALNVNTTLLSIVFLQCCTGTLDYIQKRCSEALENLHTDPEKNTKSLSSLLPSTLQCVEDIHNEVCMWMFFKHCKMCTHNTKSQMCVSGYNRWGCSEVF